MGCNCQGKRRLHVSHRTFLSSIVIGKLAGGEEQGRIVGRSGTEWTRLEAVWGVVRILVAAMKAKILSLFLAQTSFLGVFLDLCQQKIWYKSENPHLKTRWPIELEVSYLLFWTTDAPHLHGMWCVSFQWCCKPWDGEG